MLMQWGQFIAHDISASMQARMFNKTTPRCCGNDGKGPLPSDMLVSNGLPIDEFEQFHQWRVEEIN